jgi:hypothetical protein
MARHANRRPRRTPRSILTATAALGGAVVLGVAGAGGTYALWNSDTSLNLGTISSGTSGITVDGVADHPIQTADMIGQLVPGSSRITKFPVAVKNTGTVGLDVHVSSTVTGAGYLTIAVRQVASSATACTQTAYGTAPTTLSDFTLTAGQTRYLCVEAQLATNAPASVQGVPSTFVVAFDGQQVHS